MHKSSIKKNFFYQCIYEILIILLPLLTSPYLARVLGAEQVGIYSYTYSIAYFFMMFACLGVKNYGNRTIAAVRDDQNELNKTFSNIYAVMIMLATIVSAVYVVYAVFFSEYRIIAFIQFIYILSCFVNIDWFFFGIEEFRLTVTRNSIVKLITVVAIFIFVRDQGDLWKYCLILALGTLIGQAAVWYFLKDYVQFVRPSWEEMKKHIKPLFVLFIPVLAVSLYKYMDKIMLGILSTKTQVGFYENSEKVINIPTSIITAFGTVMLPRMSNLAAGGSRKQIKDYIERSQELVLCLALALAFGLAGVAQNFSVIFWGSEFEPCGNLIIALAVTIPFISYANVIRTQFLVPQKWDRPYIVSVFTGAGVNIVANLILIQRYEALGAAFGTIFAEAAVCLVQAFYVRKELPVLKYVRKAIYFLIIGVVMFVVVMTIGNMGVHIHVLLLQILVGAVVYSLFSLIYFIVTKNQTVLPIIDKMLVRLHLKSNTKKD